ncbi:putative ribonuclease H-like domain-containing protein [Tanacetum coccineum]
MIRNKARLVAQGYTQEEGIDYDEVFAHLQGMKHYGDFYLYASFKDLCWCIKMDVKSAFVMGKIEEEVLHQGTRAWYETLSTYLLDNGFQRGKLTRPYSSKGKKVILCGLSNTPQHFCGRCAIIFGSTREGAMVKAFEKLMAGEI